MLRCEQIPPKQSYRLHQTQQYIPHPGEIPFFVRIFSLNSWQPNTQSCSKQTHTHSEAKLGKCRKDRLLEHVHFSQERTFSGIMKREREPNKNQLDQLLWATEPPALRPHESGTVFCVLSLRTNTHTPIHTRTCSLYACVRLKVNPFMQSQRRVCVDRIRLYKIHFYCSATTSYPHTETHIHTSSSIGRY